MPWVMVTFPSSCGASQVVLVVKNPPAKAGDIRDSGLIPGSGRSPGGGHGNPLQYSCLDNPMDREAWWATVLWVAKSQTQLKWLSRHASSCVEKGQKLISGEISQLRNTCENCQKVHGALRPEPLEKQWKDMWRFGMGRGRHRAWKEPRGVQGSRTCPVRCGSWAWELGLYSSWPSDRGVITPILQPRLEKLQQDY